MISLFALLLTAALAGNHCLAQSLHYQEQWGYVDVRPAAHMFWWLYYENDPSRPLMLWLQGGPGASGTGFGNFQEIGPLDVNLMPRQYTWLQAADLMFIDNPVGTGFSYVSDGTSYTHNVQEIAADLLSFFKQWIGAHSQYQNRPFFIFCESYGGKMTAVFAQTLYHAIQNGELSMNFRGIALGDSWIAPADYVNSWGPYLYAFSMLAEEGLNRTNAKAAQCQSLINQGQWSQATDCWGQMEDFIGQETGGVSWYNVLQTGPGSSFAKMLNKAGKTKQNQVKRLYEAHIQPFQTDALSNLMNGPVRRKLGIIPPNVHWSMSSGRVFEYQAGDFMKPVYSTVDWLLMNSNLSVTVYNGQLDLICDTMGTEQWLDRLYWSDMPTWRLQDRNWFFAANPGQTSGFYKQWRKFQFFWILRAGHMVPLDNPSAALHMVQMIIQQN